MAFYDILKVDMEDDLAILRRKAKTVDRIDDRVRALLDDMAETMYASDGAGLAAPQIGVSERLVVIDVGNGLIKLINPVLLSSSGEATALEGCLSIPDRFALVNRPEKVIVEAVNTEGKPIRLRGKGDLARAFCHEIDHLNGILFTDKMLPESMVKIKENACKND